MTDTPRPSLPRRLFRLFLWLCLLGVVCLGILAGVVYRLISPELAHYETQVLALKTKDPSGKGWQFHSRLYSDAYVFEIGKESDPERVIGELRRLRHPKLLI